MPSMQPELHRRLPARVRPFPHETVDSYTARLLAENHLPKGTWRALVRAVAQERDLPIEEAAELAAECKGGLDERHFARTRTQLPAHPDGSRCAKCDTRNTERYACRRCTRGDIARQHPHLDGNVCLAHHLWVGPGTTPDDQTRVGEETVRAERVFRRLVRGNLLDAHRLAELEDLVDDWATAELGGPMAAPDRFTAAVHVAHATLRPAVITRLLDRSVSAADCYTLLDRAVGSAVGATVSRTVLVDRLWLLLHAPASSDSHAFRGPTDRAITADDPDPRRSCAYPRARDIHLAMFVMADRAETRDELASRSDIRAQYRCPLGHSFGSTPSIIRTSAEAGRTGCPYCANRRPLAGFNTLADTHPHLAAEWHPSKNGETRPDQVLPGAGRKAWWLCPRGHAYDVTPNARTTSGIGCGYCSNQRIAADINSLSVTHPHIAAQWHPTKNGDLHPNQVVAGSERPVWWRCHLGHDYETAPAYRAAGHGCHYCTGQKVDPARSLAALHPDIAELWHPDRNGDLTAADVMPGSKKKVWWRCPNGHDYDGAIASRTRGAGCRYCSNRARSSTNTMDIARPDLAAQWHPTKNGDLGPQDVVPGTARRIWWICEHGHDWQVSGDNRVRQNTGCPVCSGKKVIAGINDMATTHPHLAAEWHPHKNGELQPTAVVAGTAKSIWWQCTEGHEWRTSGDNRVARSSGCSRC